MWVEGRGHLPGQLIVVSGPSGTGKSTVIRRVLERAGDRVQLSVSATTREPRPGERDRMDYYFLSFDEFNERNARGEFLEWADYNGQCYGTPAGLVYDALALGKCVLLEIEVQGALQVRDLVPSALFVFVKAPSFAVLEQRLRRRGTEIDSRINKRLRIARRELAEAHWYDHVLINDDLDQCVEEFLALLMGYGRGG